MADRILEGANPADPPRGQSTRFELALDAGAARAPGFVLAQAMGLRADCVIDSVGVPRA